MNDRPLMQFDSHIAGKNATVRVWPDRIEWGKTGLMSTGAKLGLGLATAGMSLLATGVRGKGQDEMILIRSISSVTSAKSGLTKNEVSVMTPAGAIAFRCSQREAEDFKRLLLQLVATGGQPPAPAPAPAAPVQYAPPPAPSPRPADDVMGQLKKLGELRDAGILSDEEFAAKKAELLARL